MQVKCEELEYCKIKVDYQADPQVVLDKRSEALEQLRNVKIPGFTQKDKKGNKKKIPDHVLKIRFRKNIEDWVTRELISVAYDDVLFETKIRPIGYPQCISKKLSGANFKCELIFLKKPEFEVTDYKGIEIPKPAGLESVAETAQKMLQELRLQQGDVCPYEEDDFVQEGDQITISLKMVVDGVPHEGSSEGMLHVVGQFPEFDSNLYGMASGETREFDILLPDTFGSDAGKKAECTVELFMGTKKTPAPLDDELAKKFGFNNLSELQQKVNMTAQQQVQKKEFAMLTNQINRRLLVNNNFEVPSWLLNMEIQMQAQRRQVDINNLDEMTLQSLQESAEEHVRIALILETIREQEPEATLSDTEISQVIQNQVRSQVEDPEAFIKQAQQNGTMLGMVANLKNEYTMQWLVSQAKIIE